MAHVPGKESAATGDAGGAAAADRRIHASRRAHRSLGGSLLRLAAGVGAVYGLYHLWQHSEEPLPKPATEAVRRCGARPACGGGQLPARVVSQSCKLAFLSTCTAMVARHPTAVPACSLLCLQLSHAVQATSGGAARQQVPGGIVAMAAAKL